MKQNLQKKYGVLSDMFDLLETALEQIDKFETLRVEYMDDEIGTRCAELRDALVARTAEDVIAIVSKLR